MNMELAMARDAVVIEVHRSVKVAKAAAIIFAAAIFVYSVGPNLETNLMPVLRDQSVGAAFRSEGSRLCVPWHFEKTRNAIPESASARLYIGDDVNPTLMGLQHYDGSPLGAGINALATTNEPFGTVLCVKVPEVAWNSYRLGLVFVFTYRSVPMWTSTVQSPWVDWRPDRPEPAT